MLSNPAALAAQQEAIQQQILLQRDRQLSHMPPHWDIKLTLYEHDYGSS